MTYVVSLLSTSATVSSRNQTLTQTVAALPVVVAILALIITPFAPSAPAGLSVLSQTYSTTGFIQVVDNHLSKPPFRYLRCDASILGGAWLVPGTGNNRALEVLGDSIYASFVLQDAIRLAQGPKDNRALVMCGDNSS